MADTPQISVIVPMYKVERYIKLCIDSILMQTFQDFEIILVDDASPDNCVELCQKLYGDIDKIKLVRHEKNLGLGPARNTGMKHAVGKYLYFVDSDDIIFPNALEKFYTVAEKNNAQVVRTAGYFELHQDEPEPKQENLRLQWEPYSQEGFLQANPIYRLEEHWRKNRTWSMAWLCLCRRDFIEKIKLEFLPIISEDEPFNLTLFCLAERYYVMHEALYIYRRRSDSIMKTQDAAKFSKSIQSLMIGVAYVKNLLDRLPRFQNYDQWRESMLNEFFTRFINNHTVNYYKDLKLSAEFNSVVKGALEKFFGNGETFVKYFFNGYHLYRRQAELLMQERQNLIRQRQLENNLVAMFIREQPALLELMNSIKSKGKKIFLMGTPRHGNLGDQAIILGELHVLKKIFPEHNIIEIPYDYLTGELGEFLWRLGLQKHIRRDDVIFLHGGGNLGNLWLNEENLRRKLIEKFPQNKIVVFPQSIHFTDNDAGRRELAISQKIYNAHKNLHLMTRDDVSFAFAKKFFPQVNNYLLTDSATALQGIMDDVDVERQGVLFILRRDKEKIRDDAKIQRLQNYLTEKNISFEVTDTVINERVTSDSREEKIRDVLSKIRRSRLVITDRFHGVIFAVITRTPVLAFKSFDTKISSGIKWFKNIPSVFYGEDQDWSSVKNFIDKYYSFHKKKNSVASSQKIDNGSLKDFTRVLNKILHTEKKG